MGHARPLVWTGTLERAAKSKRNTVVRANRRGAIIRFARGVQVLNLSGRSGMPDMRRELSTVIPEEIGVLNEVLAEAVAEFLNRKRPLKRVA